MTPIDIWQVLAYLGSAFGGSVLGFVLYYTVGSRLRKRGLWMDSLKDLIAELKQDSEYQQSDMHIELEDAAFRHFRRAGLFFELPESLQVDLRELYSQIHLKNSLLMYYRDIGVGFLTIQYAGEKIARKSTSETLKSLLNLIVKAKDTINKDIEAILPKLNKLLDC